MAAVSGSQPKPPAGKGCFKCGKTGHWSRDCTAPPSEWVARAPTQPGTDTAPAPAQDSQPLQVPAGQLEVPVAAGKRKRQKPKLTVEHLKERHGIAEVFHTFPKKFKQDFKGQGHEAGDLRRLLEMYIGWQHRIFPYAPFDAFVEGLEKLGSSHILKMELRELRSEVLKGVDEPEEEGGIIGMGAPLADATGQDFHHTSNDDAEMPDWDDDDLVAMQAEPMEPRSNTAVPAPQQHAPSAIELDDDELLDMMGDMQPEPQQDLRPPIPASMQPPVTDTLAEEDFDDEELLELAQAGRSQQDEANAQHTRQQRPDTVESIPLGSKLAKDQVSTAQMSTSEQLALPGTEKQQAASVAATGNEFVELDDDELLEMACASMNPQQDSPRALQQPPQSLTKMSGHDADRANADSRNEAQGASSSKGVPVPPNSDTEYSLDDDELLALAATQLDGVS